MKTIKTLSKEIENIKESQMEIFLNWKNVLIKI
jgi:hypothetical protein